jgi:hypothetical protein
MNTGIQDSVNLAWKLAQILRGALDSSALDSYESERAPVGRTVLRFTDRAFRVATSTNPLIRLARTKVAPLVLPVVLGPQRLRSYAFRQVSQLAIRYRSSSLSSNGPGGSHGGPVAGDRLPDMAIVRDGQPGRLHDVVASPAWHLLVYGREFAAACQRLASAYGDAVQVHRVDSPVAGQGLGLERADLRRLGWPGDAGLLLIRPDGYVGYRSGGSGLNGLARYLERWLIVTKD